MKTSIPRLRSVKFKDGRPPLRVLRHGDRSVSDEFAAAAADIMREWRDDLAGYAIVVWNRDNGNGQRWFSGPVHSSLVPAFVHDLLLRRITLDRALKEARDE